MDFLNTYPNALTSTVFLPVKLPMVMKNDAMAIKGAIKTCNDIVNDNIKIVFIKNSLEIEEIYLSKAFWEEAKKNENLEILEECKELPFDEEGNILLWNK